jgi:hypothetical protein
MAAQVIGCICGRRHRTYNRAARCRFSEAWWINGEGPYAVLARCGNYGGRGGLTVTLWATRGKAERVLDDLRPCGGQCTGEHEIVELVR